MRADITVAEFQRRLALFGFRRFAIEWDAPRRRWLAEAQCGDRPVVAVAGRDQFAACAGLLREAEETRLREAYATAEAEMLA